MSRLTLLLFAAIVLANLAMAEDQTYTLRIGDHRPALGFTARGHDTPVTWAELEGHVVLIDFWATWCAPCRKAIPKLNALEREFSPRGVRFFSVTYETEAMVARFVDRFPIETTIGLDDDFRTFRSFKAWGIPMVVLFDRTGTVVSVVHPDHLTSALIEDALAGTIPDVKQHPGWSDPEGAETYFRSLLAKETAKP